MMIELNECQEGCGCRKSYFSGDVKQQGTSAYNYNISLLSAIRSAFDG